LGQLQKKHNTLNNESEHLGKKGELLRIDRDIKYFQERLHRAIIVEKSPPPYDRVLFGTSVDMEDESGNKYEFTIVGEDETDIDAGKISWTSPLGKMLMQGKINESILWNRPAGDLELDIIEIYYKPD
jgi:transcription elongation GreA/GreB family factor